MTDTPSYPGGEGQDPQQQGGQDQGGQQPYPPAPPPYPQAPPPYQQAPPPLPQAPPAYQPSGGSNPQGPPSSPPGPPGYPQAPPPNFEGPGMFSAPPRPPIPQSVATAVKLMYVGAALEVIGLIIALASTSSIRTAVRKAKPNDTTSQINSVVHAEQAAIVVGAIIGVALWVWMARKNQAGRNWARVLGTVFFGIATLTTLASVAEHTEILSKLLSIIVWIIGLVIVVLLWRRESSSFFKPQPQGPSW
jgi:hypothetical protein